MMAYNHCYARSNEAVKIRPTTSRSVDATSKSSLDDARSTLKFVLSAAKRYVKGSTEMNLLH